MEQPSAFHPASPILDFCPPSLPARWYTDPDHYAREMREIHAKSWIYVGRANDLPALTLRRFWTMVAHHHGQTWNSSEIAGSLGISDVTARRYLDLLSGAYMVRQLPPWFENLGKRQRRAPKAYVRDSGLLHALLGLRDQPALFSHP